MHNPNQQKKVVKLEDLDVSLLTINIIIHTHALVVFRLICAK